MAKSKSSRMEIPYQKCAREECKVEFPVTRKGRAYCSEKCKAYNWRKENPERFKEIAENATRKKKLSEAGSPEEETTQPGGGENVRENFQDDLR